MVSNCRLTLVTLSWKMLSNTGKSTAPATRAARPRNPIIANATRTLSMFTVGFASKCYREAVVCFAQSDRKDLLIEQCCKAEYSCPVTNVNPRKTSHDAAPTRGAEVRGKQSDTCCSCCFFPTVSKYHWVTIKSCGKPVTNSICWRRRMYCMHCQHRRNMRKHLFHKKLVLRIGVRNICHFPAFLCVSDCLEKWNHHLRFCSFIWTKRSVKWFCFA